MLDGRFVLEIFTSQSPQEVHEHGIDGPEVHIYPHLDRLETILAQRLADVVFLPLGFDTGIPEVIRSSAPGKTAEYLACGRPLLVHAPEDCWVSRLIRRYEAGYVVDRTEPEVLASTLGEMARDSARRETYVGSARSLAEQFRADHARQRFAEVLRTSVSHFSRVSPHRAASSERWLPSQSPTG